MHYVYTKVHDNCLIGPSISLEKWRERPAESAASWCSGMYPHGMPLVISQRARGGGMVFKLTSRPLNSVSAQCQQGNTATAGHSHPVKSLLAVATATSSSRNRPFISSAGTVSKGEAVYHLFVVNLCLPHLLSDSDRCALPTLVFRSTSTLISADVLELYKGRGPSGSC